MGIETFKEYENKKQSTYSIDNLMQDSDFPELQEEVLSSQKEISTDIQKLKSLVTSSTDIITNNHETGLEEKSDLEVEEIANAEFYDTQVKPDDNLDDLQYTSTDDMLLIDDMISAPVERGRPSKRYPRGCTLCSRTALKNVSYALGSTRDVLRGTTLNGNAFDIQNKYGSSINIGNTFGDGKVVDIQNTFSHNIKGNFFDIFTTSKSKYGHRIIGRRSEPSNRIYVIDPYTIKDESGVSSRKPVLIEEYMRTHTTRKFLKIAGYETKKKVVDSEAIVVQMKQKNDATKMAA